MVSVTLRDEEDTPQTTSEGIEIEMEPFLLDEESNDKDDTLLLTTNGAPPVQAKSILDKIISPISNLFTSFESEKRPLPPPSPSSLSTQVGPARLKTEKRNPFFNSRLMGMSGRIVDYSGTNSGAFRWVLQDVTFKVRIFTKFQIFFKYFLSNIFQIFFYQIFFKFFLSNIFFSHQILFV
jgi:hypothetical protein